MEQLVNMREDNTTQSFLPREILLRNASSNDIEAIATLHADSWRRHYRGAFSDAFLDGEVVAERRAVWSERLKATNANHFTIVADYNGEMVGFVHMILDNDPDWGALLDNLHVTYQLKRHGIGRRLLTAAARELTRCRPRDTRFSLWVIDQSAAALAFYRACGGRDGEISLHEHGPFPGGSCVLSHRMAWSDAAVLG
jgi:ribosomal protein S18 acetylase RimI-like enzyme